MQREVHDHYFHQAKRDGYRSRAAYKLIEIDERRKVLDRGDAVLDCGAAPGSWLQVAARRVGPKGVIVGIDLKPIDPLPQHSSVHLVQGDLREIDAEALLRPVQHDADAPLPSEPRRFDVVLSDMAPGTTGEHSMDHHRSVRLVHAVLDGCPDLLRPGGTLVAKVFEGETYPDLLTRVRTMFERVKGFKPKASRGESREMYVIAHGYRGSDTTGEAAAATSEEAPGFELPKRRPSTGWATPDA